MKILISPAKTLDMMSTPSVSEFSQPRFLNESQQLIETIKLYTPAQIASLMKLSDTLSMLNVERYQDWKQHHIKNNSSPAMFTFMGDVYAGRDAYTLTAQNIAYGQAHLRILIALYGVLRPLDLMQAYRLEMGTKLNNSKGTTLYQFWEVTIVDALNSDLGKEELLVNFESNEYFNAVNITYLKTELISPNFLDEKKWPI